MWWDRSEPLEIYLSDGEIGFGSTCAEPQEWIATGSLDESLRQVSVRLNTTMAPEVRKLRFWLSASLARPYLIPATSGARNRHEARALGIAMASNATGIDGHTRVWLDHWRVGESTLAVAIPESAWQGILDVIAARNELRSNKPRRARPPAVLLVSVRPWWNLALDEMLAESRSDPNRIGWSLFDGEGILHGAVERGSVLEVGYDKPGSHDSTGHLLRRRLEVNWGVASVARHLIFERQASVAETRSVPIAAWRGIPGDDV